LRQFHEQIGEVDIGPEPHQQVLAAIAPSSTAALAFNAGDDMRKLAERTPGFLQLFRVRRRFSLISASAPSRLFKNVFRGVKQPLRFLFVPVRIQNCSRV